MERLDPAAKEIWLTVAQGHLNRSHTPDTAVRQRQLELGFQALDNALVSGGDVEIINDDAFEPIKPRYS